MTIPSHTTESVTYNLPISQVLSESILDTLQVIVGRSVRAWGLKRHQKTINVSIFESVVKLNSVFAI